MTSEDIYFPKLQRKFFKKNRKENNIFAQEKDILIQVESRIHPTLKISAIFITLVPRISLNCLILTVTTEVNKRVGESWIEMRKKISTHTRSIFSFNVILFGQSAFHYCSKHLEQAVKKIDFGLSVRAVVLNLSKPRNPSTVPYTVTPNHSYFVATSKICNFATVMNFSVNIYVF